MKKIFILFTAVLLASCTSDDSNIIVKGNVKGLKKGTVYLTRILDSTYQVMDSVILNGSSDFELRGYIDEPEVLFLSLDANSSKENIINFFADKGITEINTTLKRFAFDYSINGSEQQKLLEEYKKMSRQYNNKNLDFIKQHFEALGENDSLKADSIYNLSQMNLKRKYLFTVNYALNHKNSEIAPYLALSEIYDTNIKFLDTIYKALPNDIEKSKYGQSLGEFIEKRKELNPNQ